MGNATVVIAEDNDWHRDQLSRMLSARGYDVVPARDAAELAAAMREHKPSAIFADLFLPGMCALSLANQMKVRDAHIPLTVLVSNGTEASIVRSSTSAALLIRPFDDRSLTRSLVEMRIPGLAACSLPACPVAAD